jgi:hypothetical protein
MWHPPPVFFFFCVDTFWWKTGRAVGVWRTVRQWVATRSCLTWSGDVERFA